MTRSVTIVNTSNWENEDIDVTVAGPGRTETHRLQPGDKIVCGPHNDGQMVGVMLNAVTPKKPVPFHAEDGSQDWPKVEVHKPKPSEPDAA